MDCNGTYCVPFIRRDHRDLIRQCLRTLWQVLETHAATPVDTDIIGYYRDLWEDGLVVNSTHARVLYQLVASGELSPQKAHLLIDESSPSLFLEFVDEGIDGGRWLLRSVNIILRDGDVSGSSLGQPLRDISSEQGLTPELRLKAIRALLAIEGERR